MAKKKNNYWTHERVIETAKKFETLVDFRKTHSSAYSKAWREGWLDEIKSFLEYRKQGYYTLDRIIELCQKFETIKDFRTKHKKVYDIAVFHGWIQELNKHLKSGRGIEWTFEMAKEIASDYDKYEEFMYQEKLCYNACRRRGWLPQITEHMERVGNLVQRAVYTIEFPDKHAYVGLTLDLGKRKNQHFNEDGKSQVSRYIKQTGLIPTFKPISDYILAKDAGKLERETIKKYRKQGWNILNVASAGGLGGGPERYPFEMCKEEASKYHTRIDLKEANRPIYRAIHRKGWADELLSHMVKWRNRLDKNSKLTTEQVISIKKDYDSGISGVKLSKKYNIGKTQIYRILKGEVWSHIY